MKQIIRRKLGQTGWKANYLEFVHGAHCPCATSRGIAVVPCLPKLCVSLTCVYVCVCMLQEAGMTCCVTAASRMINGNCVGISRTHCMETRECV